MICKMHYHHHQHQSLQKPKRKKQRRRNRSQKPKPAPKLQGPFSDGSKLQVLLETGWSDCGEDEMQQISNQLSTDADTKKFAIQARGAMYIIDWTDPNKITQTNPRTNKTRQLRLVKP